MPFDNDSGQGDDESGDKPLLTNNDEGTAAWMHTDKNGNAYLSVSLPFGLSVNIFPNGDDARDAFNKLAEHLGKR